LINNRQNGRRRGRGGGPRSPNQPPSPGNRQDNRSRGNAAQLLEKYKALARDAQLQGDRVQAESFLQYADHYFRVLNESRVRYEEQRRQRGDYYSDDEDDQDEAAQAAQDGDDNEEREAQPERQDRGDRFERPDRPDRGPRRDYREERNGAPRHERQRARHHEDDRDERPVDQSEERISLDVLPPAIAPVASDEDAGAKPPRARRPRRPRGEPGEEIAPAA
jgi:hypothetical protein